MTELTIIVRFPVRPERRAEFDRAFAGLLDGLSREESFLEARVHRDLDRPDDVIFYETYAETRESFLARVPQQAFFKAFLERLPDLLRAEREVAWTERVDRRDGRQHPAATVAEG